MQLPHVFHSGENRHFDHAARNEFSNLLWTLFEILTGGKKNYLSLRYDIMIFKK